MRRTVAAIAAEQERDGALPWFRGGQLDPWDSIEAAMALDVGGEHARAAAAYRWLARRQRPDGSWSAEYRDGAETSPAAESNHAGYLAVGAWHSWLLTRAAEKVLDPLFGKSLVVYADRPAVPRAAAAPEREKTAAAR